MSAAADISTTEMLQLNSWNAKQNALTQKQSMNTFNVWSVVKRKNTQLALVQRERNTEDNW